MKKYIFGLIVVVALISCFFFLSAVFLEKPPQAQPKIRGIVRYDNEDGKTVTTILTFENGQTFKFIRDKHPEK